MKASNLKIRRMFLASWRRVFHQNATSTRPAASRLRTVQYIDTLSMCGLVVAESLNAFPSGYGTVSRYGSFYYFTPFSFAEQFYKRQRHSFQSRAEAGIEPGEPGNRQAQQFCYICSDYLIW